MTGPARRYPRWRTRGNRVWRTRTPEGDILQKAYFDTQPWFRVLVRDAFTWIGRAKTGHSAQTRWRTERRLLAVWREAGFDVPRDLGPLHPSFESPRVSALEFVDGPSLLDLLSRRRPLPRWRRDELLRRFGGMWSARHRKALATMDARLLHEHATFAHVLVQGKRMVTIDMEQGHLPTSRITSLIAKEIAGYLRSLWKCRTVDKATFHADTVALVEGYTAPEILANAVTLHLRHPNRITRILHRLDAARDARRGKGGARKYVALAVLEQVLREQHPDLWRETAVAQIHDGASSADLCIT